MSDTSPDTGTLAGALATEARARAFEHPETDELLAYLIGLPESEDEKRLRRHLVACRRCARRLLELEPLAEPEPGDEGAVADFEAEASLRRLEARIREAGIELESRPEPEPQPEPEERRSLALSPPRLGYAVAAALLVAVALAVWVIRLRGTAADLRRTVDALTQPRLGVATVTLRPDDGRGPAPAAAELPPGDPFWILLVMPEDPRSWTEYEVTLLLADGTEVWQGRGTRSEEDGLRLSLSREMLQPGEYRLRLHGVDGDHRVPQGEWVLRRAAE